MALQGLARAAKTTRLSKQAIKRLNSELGLITRRVQCREYEHSAFNTNVLNIPDRARELIDDLGFFFDLGQIWKAHFRLVRLSDKDHIIDIGAGYFPKVEIALYYSGFAGRIDLFDIDIKALRQAERFMQFLHLPFKAKLCSGKSLSSVSRKYDLICANHFLDDYLLAQYCRMYRIDTLSVYAKEQVFLDIWERISSDKTFNDSLAKRLSLEIFNLSKKGSRLLLLDYLSNSQASLGIRCVRKSTSIFQKQLHKQLLQLGFVPIVPPAKLTYNSGKVRLRQASTLMMVRS